MNAKYTEQSGEVVVNETATDSLRALLAVPETQAVILKETARQVQRELWEYLGKADMTDVDDSITPLEASLLTRVFDVGAPTVVVDAHFSFAGSVLAGYYAARSEETPINVIYAASPAHDLDVSEAGFDTGTRLVVGSGMMITAEGEVLYGSFPNVIPVDLVSTSDAALAASLEENGFRVTTSAEMLHKSDDKQLLSEMVTDLPVRTPLRFGRHELIEQRRHSEVVIKPSRTSQGLGVLISDHTVADARLNAVYDFLATHNYDPLIEERIESWPIYDPVTQDRLDWNVRAIVSDGAFIDMYVRAASYGIPVNKSNNARSLTMTEFADYFNDKAVADIVLKRLKGATAALSQQLSEGLYGLDITVDTNLQSVLYEVNGENSGGIQTIAMMSPDSTEKLKGVAMIVEGWQERIAEQANDGKLTAPVSPLRTSLESVLHGAQIAKCTEVFKQLQFEGSAGRDRYAFLCGILNMRETLTPMDYEQTRAMDTLIVQEYPLEMRRSVGSILLKRGTPEPYCDTTRQMNHLYPRDGHWSTARLLAEANALDLRELPKLWRQAVANGVSQARLPEYAAMVTSLVMNRASLHGDGEFAELLSGTIITLLQDGFDAAMVRCDTEINRQYGLAEPPVAANSRFVLGVTTGHYMFAHKIFAGMDEDQQCEALNTVTTSGLRKRLLDDQEGVLRLTDWMFALDNGLDQLIGLVSHFGEIADDPETHIIGRNALEYAARTVVAYGGAADRQRLMTTMLDLTYSEMPGWQESVNQLVGNESILDLYSLALQAVVRQQPEAIEEIANLLERRSHSYNDSARLYDELSLLRSK